MSFGIVRKGLGSAIFFGVGYLSFAKAWPDDSRSFNLRPMSAQRQDILDKIKQTPDFQLLQENDDFFFDTHSSKIPKLHQDNHVSQGLLFGPKHIEIDPLIFINHKNRELEAFYHLGEKLVDVDGNIHNGVVSTILDELLCFCGFPYLPSKRGVTAQLSINFLEQIKPDTSVVLKAKVVEHKGRKVIIDGHIETLDKKPVRIADAVCVLVEPKWFKYFNWLSLF